MFALFQVEGKGAAQKIETDLQAYVKRLKYEGFTNKLKAATTGRRPRGWGPDLLQA